MDLRRLGILSGILAPLLWLSLIGIAGVMRLGFSHVAQYISELGERGSPTEALMRYAAFEFTGFLYLCFASTLWVTFRKKRITKMATCLIALDGIGRIGAGVFPCDPGCMGFSLSQDLHRMFATVGFVSGSLATIAWGVTLRKMGWPKGLTWYSIGTGPLALIFLLLMSWGQNPMNTPGLFEHLATGILSLWLIVFAAYLFHKISRLE
jgi:hypothetical membrane protein